MVTEKGLNDLHGKMLLVLCDPNASKIDYAIAQAKYYDALATLRREEAKENLQELQSIGQVHFTAHNEVAFDYGKAVNPWYENAANTLFGSPAMVNEVEPAPAELLPGGLISDEL